MSEKVRAKNATLNGVVFSETQCWAIRRCAKDIRTAVKNADLPRINPDFRTKKFTDPATAVIIADILRKMTPGKNKVVATDFTIVEAAQVVIRRIMEVGMMEDPADAHERSKALVALLDYAISQEDVAMRRLARIAHPSEIEKQK